MKSTQSKWHRDELLQALSLYCQLPFGKMHRTNPGIVVLAEHLGRSPSAVAMKLGNFASLDPSLRRRGIRGMGNISALDREVWEEYYGRWKEIAHALPSPMIDRIDVKRKTVVDARKEGPTEMKRLTRQRIGQIFFRNAVLASYEYRCCITGLAVPELLRASHIVPWSISEPDRLNPANGLCLNAMHDAAFDKGFITLDTDRKVVLSAQLVQAIDKQDFAGFFEPYSGRRINEPEKFAPLEKFLDYHRREIFRSRRT